MKANWIPLFLLSAGMLLASCGGDNPTPSSSETVEETTQTTASPEETTTEELTPEPAPTTSEDSTPVETSSEESIPDEPAVPDHAMDLSLMALDADSKWFTDGWVSFPNDKKVALAMSSSDPTVCTGVKTGGNSEITASKFMKAGKFAIEKPATLTIKVKSGTSNETERMAYIAEAGEDGLITRYINKVELPVDEAGKALWVEATMVLPKAGTYYLACNSAIQVSVIEAYYDEALTEADMTPVDETMVDADHFDARKALPTSLEGYAADKTFGNYPFPAGSVGRYYGSIKLDGVSLYNCIEIADSSFTFVATGAGILTINGTGRAAKNEDATYTDATLTVLNGETPVGEAMTFTNVNAGTKVFSTGSVALSEAGTYTISVSSVADIYRCSFAAI